MTPQQTLSLAKAKAFAATWQPGDTFQYPNADSEQVWQSGIHIPNERHYQAVVFYGETAEECEMKRDAVLAAIAFASESAPAAATEAPSATVNLSLAKAKAFASGPEAFVAWVKEPADILDFQLRADQQTGFLAGWKAAVGEGSGAVLAFAAQKGIVEKSAEVPLCVRCHGEGIVRSPVRSLPMDCPLCCGGAL